MYASGMAAVTFMDQSPHQALPGQLLLQHVCNLFTDESVPGELLWITAYSLNAVVFQLHTILTPVRGEAEGN